MTTDAFRQQSIARASADAAAGSKCSCLVSQSVASHMQDPANGEGDSASDIVPELSAKKREKKAKSDAEKEKKRRIKHEQEQKVRIAFLKSLNACRRLPS